MLWIGLWIGLLAMTLVLGYRRARRREAEARLPPSLPVVTFRPGRPSRRELAELEEQLIRQRALGRALRGKRGTPPPQVRA